MKKKLSTNGSTSQAIRDLRKAQPKANLAALRSALEARGIKASDALIKKVMYAKGSPKTKGRKRGGQRDASADSKADAIREAAIRLGSEARNRDVVADLKARGVKVSAAHVSAIRKGLKRGAKGRPGRKPAAAIVARLDFGHLQAAKAMVRQVGGFEQARQALAQLAELVSA